MWVCIMTEVIGLPLGPPDGNKLGNDNTFDDDIVLKHFVDKTPLDLKLSLYI